MKTKEVSPIMLPEGLNLTGADGVVITGTRGVILSNAQNALFIVEFDNTYLNVINVYKD